MKQKTRSAKKVKKTMNAKRMRMTRKTRSVKRVKKTMKAKWMRMTHTLRRGRNGSKIR